MPMAYPASNYHSVNGANFAKCVAKGTEGKLEIVTHPSGSLFKGNDIKRAVQTGQAPIGERLLSAHQNENILFGIDSVPFLATSFEDSEALWSVARSKIEEILTKQNLVYLYAVPWPPQGLYFKKEISAAADMKGVKFRSYNTATARLATLAGMRPVQIEAAELSQALATGVAEAFITSAATGYDGKVWEHVSHFYMVDAWMPRNTVFVNKQAWEALEESARSVVKSCADKAAAEGLEAAKAYNKLTVEGLRKGGMKIQLPGDRLRADLKKIGEAMTKEWLSQAGDAGSAILAAYRKQ
jgi:TRAP-type C4-dicarboxylate transport system substrate-binding protein